MASNLTCVMMCHSAGPAGRPGDGTFYSVRLVPEAKGNEAWGGDEPAALLMLTIKVPEAVGALEAGKVYDVTFSENVTINEANAAAAAVPSPLASD